MEEKAKIDHVLTQIGALDFVQTNWVKVIRLKVILAAFKVHKYEYSNITVTSLTSSKYSSSKSELTGKNELDYDALSPKSIRIMNRFTRVIIKYHDANYEKLISKSSPFARVIRAVLSSQI